MIRLSCATLLASLALASACTAPIDPDGDDPNAVPVLTKSVFVPGLSGPWDIAFHSDGTMFFTERCGGLSVRRTNGTIARLFGVGGALTAPDLVCQGQSGMLGVALDPAFASNRRIYVYMTSNLVTEPRTNRVVRLVLDPGYTGASSRTDIVNDIAYKDVANGVGGAGAHSGGRIRFGPDGYLYITTGDNHDPNVPQSPTLLGGKVLRVTTDGTAAPGNDPPIIHDDRIFTYGHRNVQGIAFHPVTDQPFISEHGPNHSDEVTPLVNGGNGGWDPQDRPTLTCPDGYCGYAGTPVTMPMTDVTRFPAALTPIWDNGGQSQGTGPATFLTGSQWLAWNGRLAVGVMGSQRLVILRLDASGAVVNADDASIEDARYRSLVQGPDGALYIAVDGGEVWRITPSAPPPAS